MTADRKLIICPFAAEARMLLAVLFECRKTAANTWQNKDFVIRVLNGFGEKPIMDFFAGEFKEGNVLPAQIVLFGSAGALAQDIEPGQVFLCEQLNLDDLSINLTPERSEINNHGNCQAIKYVTQITVREAVFTPAARAELHAKTGAAIVDMESFFFAREALKLGIKPVIIRFISDTAKFPFKMPFADTIRNQLIKARQPLFSVLSTL